MLYSFDNYKFFFYFEPSLFLFIGKLGSFKFKTILNFYYILHTYVLDIAPSILSFFNNWVVCKSKYLDCYLQINKGSILLSKVFFFLKYLFLQIVLSIYSGWSKKLRLIGIGYKIYYSKNLIILKIGYSNYIICLLPYELRILITGRKKRSYTLFGINKLLFGIILKFILCLRIPNVYTGKGIRLRGFFFTRKAGKKSQF